MNIAEVCKKLGKGNGVLCVQFDDVSWKDGLVRLKEWSHPEFSENWLMEVSRKDAKYILADVLSRDLCYQSEGKGRLASLRPLANSFVSAFSQSSRFYSNGLHTNKGFNEFFEWSTVDSGIIVRDSGRLKAICWKGSID